MRIFVLFTLVQCFIVNAQHLPKELRNVLNVLSVLKIKPESFIKFATNANESQCNQDFRTVFTEAANQQRWAWEMIDATAKIQDGLFNGQRIYYGDFEQCLETKIPNNFQSQYCLLSVNVNAAPKFQLLHWIRFPMIFFGVCVPSTCSPQYIENFLHSVQFPKSGKNLTQYLEIFINKSDCIRPDETIPFTPLNWIALCFCITVIILVIASTIYEAMFPTTKLSYFTSFSVLTNGRDIFAPATSTKPINGLRGVFALQVVIGHSCLQLVDGNLKNLTLTLDFHESWFLSSAFNTIDAFIIISGMLSVIAFYSEISKRKSFDPIKAIISRHLRLVIPAGVLFLLRMGLSEHLHRGPIYNALNNYQTRNCHKSWLSVLLGHDNFKNPRVTVQCFPQFWYLSLDMQLFIVTQILFVITKRHPKLLVKIVFILFIFCDLLTFYLSFIHDCGWSAALTLGPQFMDHVYSFPYTRGVSWFAGMLWGFLLLQNQKTDFRIHKTFQKIMWVITIPCLYYSQAYLKGKYFAEYTQPEGAFYSAFHHVTSAIAYGWIIFSLLTQISGPLGVILSWGPLVFLGNLSYELYLVHYSVTDFLMAISRNNVYSTFHRLYYNSITIVSWSTIAALIFAICITRPIANLTSLITKRIKILPLTMEIQDQTRTNKKE